MNEIVHDHSIVVNLPNIACKASIPLLESMF